MTIFNEKLNISLCIAKVIFNTQDAITFFKAENRLLPLQNRETFLMKINDLALNNREVMFSSFTIGYMFSSMMSQCQHEK